MKTIKLLLLAMIFVSCSPERIEEPSQDIGCECTKHIYSDIGTVLAVYTDYVVDDCESEGSYPDNIITEDNVNYTITCD